MPDHEALDRREFLTRSAGAMGALGAAALVGPGALRTRPSELAKIEAAAKPKRGGTLIIGSLGSTTDTVDNQLKASSNMDQERGQNLYDSLTYIPDPSYGHAPALAEHIILNATATSATFYLRKGVEFHNGKTFTADDLIFSLQRILNPAAPGKAHTSLASINPNALAKVNDYVVTAELNFPDAFLPARFGSAQTAIVPVGFDPTHPVGTGPFMFQSFTPGSQSTFVRNPNYWVEGQPYLDELQIIDFADDTSRVAALLAGQVHAIDGIDPSLLPEIKAHGGFSTMVTKSGYYQPITMRTDLAPFNDARVRQAFRLLVDRPGMVKQAYGNRARIGNDMPDPTDPNYPTFPQRHQDIKKAKSLLKAAGYGNGLNVTLTTSPNDVDLVNSALVFAQQVQQANAGVTVTVNQITNAAYNAQFTKWPFTQGYWAANLIGTSYASRFLGGGPNNDSHWNDPVTDQAYFAALKEIEPSKQKKYLEDIFQVFYESGPDIAHTFKDQVDVFTDNFQGFTPAVSNGWSLGGYRYRLVWSK